MLPKPGMWMRLGSTDCKGTGSCTGTFEPDVSLVCGSIRPRFSHVAAARRQKKVHCVFGGPATCVRRTHVTSVIVAARWSRTTGVRSPGHVRGDLAAWKLSRCPDQTYGASDCPAHPRKIQRPNQTRHD